MDKRIAIPAGLALMVVLAVIGVMSLLSFTATQPAEADISPATNIQYRMSDRGLGQASVHTVGPFKTSVPLTTLNGIRLAFPTGHGFTLPTTGSAVTVNGINADTVTLTTADDLDIKLGVQTIPANTDITVVLSSVTNTATFNGNLQVTVSDQLAATVGVGIGIGPGTTQNIPISPLTQQVLQAGFLPSALQNPTKPGVAASYTLTFITPSTLVNGIDEIVLTFADDYQVPGSIDRSNISISADAVLLSDGNPTGSANESVAPLEVSVDSVSFQGSEQDEPEITIRVPDMATGDQPNSIGGNSIQAGAKVTIIIRQAAGIKNPSESGSQRIDVRTSTDAGDVEMVNPSNGLRVFTPLILEMSSEGDPRGENLTLTALGVEGGKTATFWLDLNGDSIRQSSERDLCNVVATSGDIAVCDFTVSNPPYVPGTSSTQTTVTTTLGAAVATTTVTTVTVIGVTPSPFAVGNVIEIDDEQMLVTAVTDNAGVANDVLTVQRRVLGTTAATHPNGANVFKVNVNFINVVDGESRVTTGALSKTPYSGTELSRQTFELEPTISVSPSSANVGDTVTLSLFDYPAGPLPAAAIFIGGNNATPASFGQTVPPSGELSFGFKLPGTAVNGARIPTGTQRFEVRGFGGSAQDTDLTIGGARLTLSHDSLVANQDLTITGSGFSDGNNICIVEGQITVNNVAVEFDDDNDCPQNVLTANPINGVVPGEGILLTSGGTFTATVRVHDQNISGTTTSINTALLTEGNVELKVIDTNGAEGTLKIDIEAREIAVTPASARPRDTVTIVGKRFIADNPDGVSTSVGIEYSCGTDTRSVTADPDASGNFRETLRIPSGCSIPSTNTITATIDANGTTGVVETVTHEIPEALVRIDPIRGAPGDRVTVSGEGFRTFETLESIEFGDLSVLGGRTVNTDGNGDFTVDDILVPGEDPGIHAVKIEIGTGDNRTTSSTSFEILDASGTIGGATTPIETALAPLFEDDSLDRAFFFNNVTKEWSFFINDDAFLSANDLDDIPSGQPIWIKVTEDKTVDLNNVEFDLSCINAGTPEEDCWNQIVFP